MQLNDLYTSYTTYCEQKSIFPATKDYVGKVILKVLPSGRKSRKREGNLNNIIYLGLHGLGISCDNNEQFDNQNEIHLPEFCTTVVTSREQSIQFLVPTMEIINGVGVNFNVLINGDYLDISVNDIKINLSQLGFNEKCCINQRNINAVICFLKYLNICKGVAEPHCAASFTMDSWIAFDLTRSKSGDMRTEKRIRHKNCDIALEINGTADHCRTCMKYFCIRKTDLKKPLAFLIIPANTRC